MRYFVISDDGNKYGPADIATLNSWITEGRLVSTTLLEEEGSGARMTASAVAGLVFPNAGPAAAGAVYTQAPGPAAQNPYSAGYSNAYQAAPPAGGNTETIISWIMGVLGLLCCGLFPIVGIILAVVGKNKGNRNAQAAMIFNIVVLVIAFGIAAVIGPQFIKGFQQGLDRAQHQQSGATPGLPTPTGA